MLITTTTSTGNIVMTQRSNESTQPMSRDERRVVAELAPVLTQLGLGRKRGDIPAAELMADAVTEIKRLQTTMRDLKRLLAETSNALQEMSRYAASPPSDKHEGHEVQFRAVDLDDGVHIRGVWQPLCNEDDSQVRNEMLALQSAGYDLRIVRYERCGALDLTRVMEPRPE
jgi:hypothetical protein